MDLHSKPFKIITAVLLVVTLCFMTACSFDSAGPSDNDESSGGVSLPADTELESDQVIVEDITDNKIVYEKNPDEKTRPASLAKILSAIVILENTDDMDQKVQLMQRDYDNLKNSGIATSGFLPGEKATVDDYLHGMIFCSGADACLALARYVGGSETGFVDMMNKKADELGMDHSSFGDPIGLDSDDTYITVSDFSKLLKYALKNDRFRSLFQGRKYTIKANNKRKADAVITNAVFSHTAADTLIKGGKLGYTKLGRKSLASNAVIGGREYICITAHAAESINDLYPNIKDTEKIYNEIREQN